MSTSVGRTQWLQTYALISQDENKSEEELANDVIETTNDDDSGNDDYWYDYDDDYEEDDYNEDEDEDNDSVSSYDYDDEWVAEDNAEFERLTLQRERRLNHLRPLFDSEPKFERICKNWNNRLVDSGFELYSVCNEYTMHEIIEDDVKYTINLCGYTLTRLNIHNYPFSDIMPLIKNNCPNLKNIFLKFIKIESNDFENVFSNMCHLEKLTIKWEYKDSTLPLTLVKSLEQVNKNLIDLTLSSELQENNPGLTDSLASVFPKLTALKNLTITGFDLSQPLIESIGKMKNLNYSHLLGPKISNPMFNKKINMYPIGNLESLQVLYISRNHAVTDELLFNFGNDAKNIKFIEIDGTNITDNGIIALNNINQLESFKLTLYNQKKSNTFITDKSIECLYNKTLRQLYISNCINITNKSVIKLVENLPNLNFLCIHNTKVNYRVVLAIAELTKYRTHNLNVNVFFKDHYNIFDSLRKTHNVSFWTNKNNNYKIWNIL